jgi:hypothetical protein
VCPLRDHDIMPSSRALNGHTKTFDKHFDFLQALYNAVYLLEIMFCIKKKSHNFLPR